VNPSRSRLVPHDAELDGTTPIFSPQKPEKARHFGRTGVPALHRTDYNVSVATPAPQQQLPDDKHRHRHSIYAAEATGLLLMAVLLLILIIIRYWAYIPWSAR